VCLEASRRTLFVSRAVRWPECVQHRRGTKSGTRARAHATVRPAAKYSQRLSCAAIAQSLISVEGTSGLKFSGVACKSVVGSITRDANER
jgi:hypothetical protein